MNEEHRYLPMFYYKAVQDLQPVELLEEMRTMEAFYWEEDASERTYSPSEALIYALVHNHQEYAQYLLAHYSEEALVTPGKQFCCYPSRAQHLVMAVRYNRLHILAQILQEVHRMPSLKSWYVNTSGGCIHVDDGKTALHLACEMLSLIAVQLLLGNGASPLVVDNNGMTPLDVILQQLGESESNSSAKELCLELLLMFMPKMQFKMRSALEKEPKRWSEVLGEDTLMYLIGKNPPSLFFMNMRRTLSLLPPDQFFTSLNELPIPALLTAKFVPSL